MANAIQNSLINKNIYYICCTRWESPENAWGELSTARRNFFSMGRKPVKIKEHGEHLGYSSQTSGSIRPRSFKWKKSVGKLRIEEAFYIGKAFVVVRRDLNGSICGKIHFDRDLRWIKTEYFSPEDYLSARTILKPRESSDGLELFTYDISKKRYESQILYPVPYARGSQEQSLLNAKYGEPLILAAMEEGEFSYCPKDEQKKIIKELSAIEKDSLLKEPTEAEKEEELPKDDEPEADFISLYEAAAKTMGVDEAEAQPVSITKEKPAPEQEPELKEEPQPKDEEALQLAEPTVQKQECIKKAESAEPAQSEAVEEAVISSADLILERTMDEQAEDAIEAEPQNDAFISESELALGIVEDGEKFNYTGRLMCGKRQGRGRTDQPGGLTVFDGNYMDGLRQGFGSVYSLNGKLNYAGFWNGDQKEGGGVSFRDSDHAMNVGSWSGGKPMEWRALFDPKGRLKYFGRICGGNKTGAGVTLRQEDRLFVGKYSGDSEPAEGALFDKNGNLMYSGGWKNGMRHGQGVEFDADGQLVYCGMWHEDKYLNGVLYKKVKED